MGRRSDRVRRFAHVICCIEGPDGAGKTVLAGVLQAQLQAELFHRGPPTLPMLEEYEQPLDKVTGHVVCDRWHLGELVYGPLLRGESRLTTAERFHIELYLHARGGFIVHVDTPIETVRRRFKARGDDLIQADQLTEITARYREIMDESRCPVLTVRGSGPTAVDSIIDFGVTCDLAIAPLRDFETYVGGPEPRVLLLGETRGDPERFRAAFPPASATSGRFLLEALLLARTWKTGELGIANALDENVAKLHPALGWPTVVALGRKAEAVCAELEIHHSVVPHPQYQRRFHYGEKAQYGQEIVRLSR